MQLSQGVRTNRTDLFKELLERFSMLARDGGYQTVPYEGLGPKFFSALPETTQVQVLGNFARFMEVCEEVVRGGASLKDDAHFLWRMFHKLGVHPPSSLMDQIHSGEIIEIYNVEFVQVFRNLRFFTVCSYTLDELLCRPFWELFRRDESVTEKLVGVSRGLFTGEISGIQQMHTGMHSIEETDSPLKYSAVVENRLIAPLADASKLVTAIVTTIKVISFNRHDPAVRH